MTFNLSIYITILSKPCLLFLDIIFLRITSFELSFLSYCLDLGLKSGFPESMASRFFCNLFTMFLSLSYVTPLATNASTASSASVYYPPSASCQQYKIPMSVSVPALVYNGTVWKDNFELIDFVSVQGGRIAKPSTQLFEQDLQDYKGTFEIAATFCTPRNTKTAKQGKVILATHGLWFSHTCGLQRRDIGYKY